MRHLDLFSGIGGFALAARWMGWHTAAFCERDPYCQKLLAQNFPDTPIHDDIRTIPPIGGIDIITGGFPCQPFSISGKMNGFSDARGTLLYEILRIAKTHQPEVLFLENVRNYLNHACGETMRTTLLLLNEIGYDTYYKILSASNYGIPQKRERIFIIGVRNDISRNSLKSEFEWPIQSEKETKVGSILEKNPDKKYTISKLLWDSHKKRKERNKARGVGFGYGEVNSQSPYTRTLSARYYKDGSEVLINMGDGKNPRKLTPRECANLQGFPKSFKLNKSDNQAYRQFGNSVSVPVIRAIALKMIDFIKKK